MKRAGFWPLLLVGALIVALAVLATLQVRWIGQVSAAQEQRARAELEGAGRGFSEELHHELARLIGAFELSDINELPRRYDVWAATTRDPSLLSALYVVELHQGGRSLLRFDPSRHELRPAEWPPSLESLRDETETHTSHAELPPMMIPVRAEGRERRSFLVVQFNTTYVTQKLVPELARRFFHGFDVAVAHGNAVVYRSNAAWPRDFERAQPDLAWPLLMMRQSSERAVRSREQWQLLLRHHGEPLTAVIAAARHRDLAIATAILSLLAASIVILAAVARRAERLRRQQLEFVAGITHELH